MIIDTFERALAYDLGPLWERVFPEFLALYAHSTDDPIAAPLDACHKGDGVFVNVEEYAVKDWDAARYEGHEKMADVQTLLSGEEYIDVMPLWKGADVLGGEAERYDERDLIFYAGKPAVPAVRFHLVPGMFALLLPGEAHQPCMKAGSERVKKLVIKIPAAGLKAPASV